MAKHAERLVEDNGFGDVIMVMQDSAESMELPEKVRDMKSRNQQPFDRAPEASRHTAAKLSFLRGCNRNRFRPKTSMETDILGRLW